MKTLATFCAILGAVLSQIYFIGLNGLTLVSIPLTICLGLEVLERLTETQANN